MMLPEMLIVDSAIPSVESNGSSGRGRDSESNSDRWRKNTPTGPPPPRLATWAASMGFLIVSVMIAAVLLSAVAWGSDAIGPANGPELVLFTAPGCPPCDAAKLAIERKEIGRGWNIRYASINGPLWLEFKAAITPIDQDLNPEYTGPLDKRPAGMAFLPTFWPRGSTDCWYNYSESHRERLIGYLRSKLTTRKPPIGPETERTIGTPATDPEADRMPVDQAEPTAEPGPIEPVPDPLFQPTPTESPTIEDFDGVHVIVLVRNLADQAVDLRAEAAQRANAAVQELAKEKIGDKAAAYLIAEVADQDTFGQLRNLVGADFASKPVHVVVLVPARLSGFKGWLAAKAEQIVADHYLATLRSAGVSVVLERLSGGTYDAAVAILSAADGGSPPGNSPGNSPLIMLLAAWLAERSDLVRRLLQRLGYA